MTHDPHAVDSRERILVAAAHIFADAGYRGATTRRIAQEADVNEVTLFRHFGSKEELIREAIAHMSRPGNVSRLPETPVDPEAELTAFGREQLEHLFRVRSFIRTCMGEGEERPDISSRATDRPVHVHHELLTYLGRLRDHGLAAADANVDAAATMLMGALFSDAMGRDYMPQAYSYAIDEAPARYVRLILRSVGAPLRAPVPTAVRKRKSRERK